MQPHPNIERFRSDYIPFIEYRPEELVPDNEEDEKNWEDEKDKRIKKFKSDTYFLPMIPQGWLQKQIGIRKGNEFGNVFSVEYDKQACNELKKKKTEYCKSGVGIKCYGKDSKETLREKHDAAMRCRNIRVLESFSNCGITKDDGSIERYFKHNAFNHTEQANSISLAAKNCTEIYNKKLRREELDRKWRRSKSKKSRSKHSRSRSNKFKGR